MFEKIQAFLGMDESTVRVILITALRIVASIALIFFSFVVAAWAKRAVHRALQLTKIDITLLSFFSRATHWVVLLLAVLSSLSILGIQTTSFAAIIGAAGLAIGLALQQTLSNIAAGVLLLIFRPFKVGDMVILEGRRGLVDEIDLFTTTICTIDNRRVIVPNNKAYGNLIENLSHHDSVRVAITVWVPESISVEESRKLLRDCGEAITVRIVEQGVEIRLCELDKDLRRFEITVWTPRQEIENVWELLLVEVAGRFVGQGVKASVLS